MTWYWIWILVVASVTGVLVYFIDTPAPPLALVPPTPRPLWVRIIEGLIACMAVIFIAILGIWLFDKPTDPAPNLMLLLFLASLTFGVVFFFVARSQSWSFFLPRTWPNIESAIDGIIAGLVCFLILWVLSAIIIYFLGLLGLDESVPPTPTPVVEPTATQTVTVTPTEAATPIPLSAEFSHSDLEVLPVTVKFAGHAEPGRQVVLVLDGNPLITVTANTNGSWVVEGIKLETPGLHEIAIRSIDSNGNILEDGGKASFDVIPPTPAPTATFTPIPEWTAIASQATALAEKDDLLQKQDLQLATAEAQLTALALTPTATMVVVTATPTPTQIPPTATRTPAPRQAVTGPTPVIIHIQGNGINITITGTLKNGN